MKMTENRQEGAMTGLWFWLEDSPRDDAYPLWWEWASPNIESVTIWHKWLTPLSA